MPAPSRKNPSPGVSACGEVLPPGYEHETSGQGKAGADEIGRMESAKPVRPIAAGKDADADAQVPGGLVGGGGHPSPFGRGHPDEQGVERRVQRPERKSLHKSYANVGTHGQLRIALRQSADEGQAGVARSDQEQAANDEPAGAATVRPFARKEARDAEPDGHGRTRPHGLPRLARSAAA